MLVKQGLDEKTAKQGTCGASQSLELRFSALRLASGKASAIRGHFTSESTGMLTNHGLLKDEFAFFVLLAELVRFV